MKRKIVLILTIGLLVLPTSNVFAEENLLDKNSDIKANEESSFEIRDFKDLEILEDELDEFINKNPKSTEAEQELHLIKFVKSGKLARVETRGVGDYIPGFNSLNYAEKKLALAHPIQAIKVYNTTKTAESKTIEVYGYNGYQDNSDAFRHCFWNALMKKSIGEDVTEQWATAHEYDSSGIDKEMDLYNNNVGRNVYVTNKSIDDIVGYVKYRVKNGWCKRIVNNELIETDDDGMD